MCNLCFITGDNRLDDLSREIAWQGMQEDFHAKKVFLEPWQGNMRDFHKKRRLELQEVYKKLKGKK